MFPCIFAANTTESWAANCPVNAADIDTANCRDELSEFDDRFHLLILL